MNDLKGKNIIVTGASGGIGNSIIEKLNQAGANILASGTRTENNMFGSLKNTTTAGTPILLNYGLFRVGGQFLSGYVLSQQHAQDSAPSVQSIFNANQTPLAAEAVSSE